jgi:Flp pilus assembly protein TadG
MQQRDQHLALRQVPLLRQSAEGGQLSVLILGFLLIAMVLVVGGVDVTAAQLARIRLVDVADAAALDAADALDTEAAYRKGVTDAVVLSSATVRQAAAAYLGGRIRPEGVRNWGLAAGTGAQDAATAVVVLDATVELPMTGGLLSALGKDVSVRVEARARAPLQPTP